MGAFLWMNADISWAASGKQARDIFARQMGKNPISAPISPILGELTITGGEDAPLLFSQNDAGEFAALTGTPYAEKFGSAEHLPRQLLSGKCNYTSLMGGFALLSGGALNVTIQADKLGQQHIYVGAGGKVISTSFLATATAVGGILNVQALREYIFNGATYGGDTLSDQVKLLPAGASVKISQNGAMVTDASIVQASSFSGSFNDAVEATASILREIFAGMLSSYGAIDTALSAGFDTRLMLALLVDAGVSDYAIHVYGAANSADVMVAKTIAAGEGFPLVHKDKTRMDALDSDGWQDQIAANYIAFDGLPPDGIIDSGTDLASRRDRAAGGRLALNGGGGEIMRNFFYLPNRRYRVSELLDGFYRRYAPSICGADFDEKTYRANFAEKILKAVGLQGDVNYLLTRSDIERIYPLFRGRFWMDANTSRNMRFGRAITPFANPDLIALTSSLPYKYKNYGRLQAAVINHISPQLAAYMSDYGFNFQQGPDWKYKAKSALSLYRPTWLRRLSYPLQHGRMPIAEAPEGMEETLWEENNLSEYFDRQAMRDPAQIKRLMTTNYVTSQLGLK